MLKVTFTVYVGKSTMEVTVNAPTMKEAEGKAGRLLKEAGINPDKSVLTKIEEA